MSDTTRKTLAIIANMEGNQLSIDGDKVLMNSATWEQIKTLLANLAHQTDRLETAVLEAQFEGRCEVLTVIDSLKPHFLHLSDPSRGADPLAFIRTQAVEQAQKAATKDSDKTKPTIR